MTHEINLSYVSGESSSIPLDLNVANDNLNLDEQLKILEIYNNSVKRRRLSLEEKVDLFTIDSIDSEILEQLSKIKEPENPVTNNCFLLDDLIKNNGLEDYNKIEIVIEILNDLLSFLCDARRPKERYISKFLPKNIEILKKTEDQYEAFFKSITSTIDLPVWMQNPNKQGSGDESLNTREAQNYFYAISKYLELLFPNNENEDLNLLIDELQNFSNGSCSRTIKRTKLLLEKIRDLMKRDHSQIINLKFNYINKIDQA